MTKLAFICNWRPEFGYLDNELDYINYFKKKKFVIYSYCFISDIIEFRDGQTNMEFIGTNGINNSNYNITQPVFIKEYYYRDRTFCNINDSFYIFIKKCKTYYKNKIKHYKNPKNILHRQQFGKFYSI